MDENRNQTPRPDEDQAPDFLAARCATHLAADPGHPRAERLRRDLAAFHAAAAMGARIKGAGH